jgi:hypothetical protein
MRAHASSSGRPLKRIEEVESRQRQAELASGLAAAKQRTSEALEAIPAPMTACWMNRRRLSVLLKPAPPTLRQVLLLIVVAVIASA